MTIENVRLIELLLLISLAIQGHHMADGEAQRLKYTRCFLLALLSFLSSILPPSIPVSVIEFCLSSLQLFILQLVHLAAIHTTNNHATNIGK